MITKIFTIQNSDDPGLAEAAKIIVDGGLLAIPTETVYGLGANALDSTAVSKIFEAKGRPQDNPLILLIPDAAWLERYCKNVPQIAYRLAERFWPGPLTIILYRNSSIPDCTTSGLETVAMRCPDDELALSILKLADVPIAAPSANQSGRPSCTTVEHVLEDMNGKIEGIVDGGTCPVGVESTIVDLTCDPPRLLRPGGLPLEDIQEVIVNIDVDKAVFNALGKGEKPKAPGMKYRHYAPRAPLTVLTGDSRKTADYIKTHMSKNAGVICFDEYLNEFDGCIVQALGSIMDKQEQARRVFDALRFFDQTDVDEIWAQCPDNSGLGLAIGNRLKKAAGHHVIELL